MKKIRTIILSVMMFGLLFVDNIQAEGFDTELAKKTLKDYLDPITNLMLWLVPLLAVVAALATGLRWLAMDEQQREQRPILQSLKKLGIGALVIWSIPVIFKIIGL